MERLIDELAAALRVLDERPAEVSDDDLAVVAQLAKQLAGQAETLRLKRALWVA